MLREPDLRPPTSLDGMNVFQLIKSCPPLDTNSSYCNLLQCSHFAETSVAAELGDNLVGFISGYLLPERPDTLFIWQVAVAEQGRGQGLASKMLQHILERKACSQVSYLETTITESNQASWGLFRGLAKHLSADIHSSVMFDCEEHFNGQHDSEELVSIGPFTSAKPGNLSTNS